MQKRVLKKQSLTKHRMVEKPVMVAPAEEPKKAEPTPRVIRETYVHYGLFTC
jgi:hypothetical protein